MVGGRWSVWAHGWKLRTDNPRQANENGLVEVSTRSIVLTLVAGSGGALRVDVRFGLSCIHTTDRARCLKFVIYGGKGAR